MRPIKELLVLLREFLPENIKEDVGGSICWSVADMYFMESTITREERNFLLDYIEQNRPGDAGNYRYSVCSEFWWPYGELAPRIEFLNKLIDELP